ncbi:MAG TPA: hypothetical protein VIP98_14945 [Microlunatus sp.]
MSLVLTLVSAIAWTVVYVAAIRIGFRDKTYAMPIAALALNIAWEWLYAIQGIGTDPGSVQTWVNLAWGLADVLILITFFRYGRRDLPALVTRGMFAAWGIGMITAAVIIQLLFVVEFGFDGGAPVYSAFLQNLLMSGLFIAMFVSRRGSRGQSLVIAIAKWVGTLAPTILFGFLPGSLFVIGIGPLCSVFDLAYIGLLWADRRGRTSEVAAAAS